ncbi:arsenate reductase (glutaredoxin) [Flavobacterium noncentrifugens]|uniref:Arsenate reductase n=1 Tax=Flavobacterium noncentrifugens TaxID=1128970 RepID=A0A1G9D767_9FLAO|nr:arsenate reductase (glutaredoxin) [Flavobacterium noncentrifugens]GEP52580.1 arsenate reductase (glutaredoxin) [Flavobacterium noncentrifugens]SDK59703.1 arsenate reductase [Flavobacterium noncentrifugens]
MIQVLHNPRCGKSRSCLAFLEESGKEFEVIKYLVDVPTFDELQSIIKKLGMKPIEVVRTKEPIWIEKFKSKTLSDAEIIKAMVQNPILIERPIVINGDKAIIARPMEKAAEII